jgi:hypothetical protein
MGSILPGQIKNDLTKLKERMRDFFETKNLSFFFRMRGKK